MEGRDLHPPQELTTRVPSEISGVESDALSDESPVSGVGAVSQLVPGER